MPVSFLTNLNEQEFKAFLKESLKEVLKDNKTDQEKRDLSDKMNAVQAAAYLDLEVSTIYYMTCKRLIPHAKKGKKLYFLRTELDQWIAQGKRKMLSDLHNVKLKR